MRKDAATAFNFIFDKAQSFATNLQLETTRPRITGGKNSHFEDPDLLTHFRTSMFCPFLDNFVKVETAF